MPHIVITGGNAGIGFAAAKLFLSKGNKVTIVGRSQSKLEEAKKLLGEVSIGICDLSSISSIDAFVQKMEPFDVLVNNAGVWLTDYTKTDNGLESTFAINHLGTMYLTLKILKSKKIVQKGSIIIVSSDLHTKGVDDLNFFDNLNEKSFDGFKAYSQTKLYNLLLAQYLATEFLPKKYSSLEIKVATVHPGFIPTTELKRNNNFFVNFIMNYIFPYLPFTTTVEDGANRIYKAFEDSNSNGKYIGNKGYEEPSELARDLELAKALWKKSLVELQLEESSF
eukprot:NODE_185_length_13590_cov_0.472908.p7 type:complete len:280 gc:universal NODE_185_length_13590_cov_0.472908:9122-9961(+)